MAIVGNSANPSNGYLYNDFGSGIQYWSNFSMTGQGGNVSDIYVYVGGDGVSFTGYLCFWHNGALLFSSGGVTFPSNGRVNGGQQWLHASVPNVYCPSGNVDIGFWAGGNAVWTQGPNTGSVQTYRQNSSVGSPSNEGASSQSAATELGAYLVYTPSQLAVRRGGVWTYPQNIYTRRSGSWTRASGVYVRRSGAWVRIW